MANYSPKFSIKVSAHIEGLDALRIAMKDHLPAEIQAKVLSDAVAKGALVVRDAARQLAPVLKSPSGHAIPGVLRDAIRSTRGVRRDTDAASFVSVRLLSRRAIKKFKQATGKSARANPRDPFYWRFVELGTSKMPAQSFLRKGFDESAPKAAERIKEAMRAGIARAVARIAKGRR